MCISAFFLIIISLVIMGKLYYFTWANGSDFPVAFISTDKSVEYSAFVESVEGLEVAPFTFRLKAVKELANGIEVSDNLSTIANKWPDYMPNSKALPLFSKKLKDFFLTYLHESNGVEWIECQVFDEIGQSRAYFILRFKIQFDVINPELSFFNDETGDLIRPHFDLSKTVKYTIFTKPRKYNFWKISSALYVHENLKAALKKENFKGISFEKVNHVS